MVCNVIMWMVWDNCASYKRVHTMLIIMKMHFLRTCHDDKDDVWGERGMMSGRVKYIYTYIYTNCLELCMA